LIDALDIDHDNKRREDKELHVATKRPTPRDANIVHVLVMINVVDIQHVPPPISD
jgi:hypothetical protein